MAVGKEMMCVSLMLFSTPFSGLHSNGQSKPVNGYVIFPSGFVRCISFSSAVRTWPTNRLRPPSLSTALAIDKVRTNRSSESSDSGVSRQVSGNHCLQSTVMLRYRDSFDASHAFSSSVTSAK
jgi:hypothetical protein